MTPRERVHAVLNRQMPDRLPKDLKMTGPLAETFRQSTGIEDPLECFGIEMRDVTFRPILREEDFRPYYPDGLPPLLNDKGWEVGEWGVGEEPGSLLHFIRIRHPMANLTHVAELERYPFPDMTLRERHRHLEAEVQSLHERDLFAIGYVEWTIFELAWYMRGMDNLFVDLAENEPFVEYLLERITEARCFQANRYAEAGADMIRIGDDIGTQRAMLMSPATYRKWFKPRHRRVIEAARKVRPEIAVQYHSDGNCWPVIGDLIEIGVTVLNPVQPECLDQAAVKREFGKDLVFWGGIGTQTTMPFASADEVYRTVQQTIDVLGPTGFCPSPTHVLEPEVPVQNVLAYIRAVDEYRV